MLITTTEQTYVNVYRDMIECVSYVERYVTSAHRRQLDTLEAQVDKDRIGELREVARCGMST